MGIFRRLFKGLGFLIFLLILLVAGWIFREEIGAWLANVDADDIVVEESVPEFGPAAAAQVDTALRELAAGRDPGVAGPARSEPAAVDSAAVEPTGESAGGDEAAAGPAAETRFTETDLQSYVRYQVIPRLPAGVGEPALELRDSTVAFSVMLHFTQLPIAADAAATLSRMLGDSARVAGEVRPEVGEIGEGRLDLVNLRAGVIPVPPMMVGMAAQQLGLRMDGGTVLFDIPASVIDVRVENGEIVLVTSR